MAPTATSRPACLVDGHLEVDGVGARAPPGSAATGRRAARGRTARRRTPCGTPPARRPRSRRRASRAEQVARIPRGIGTRMGVKLTRTGSLGRPREVLLDLGRVPVAAADAVRRQVPITSLPSRCGLAALPAPRGAATRPRRRRRARPALRRSRERARGSRPSGSSRGRRSGARPRRTSRCPGQLGQAVGPRAGVVRRRRTVPRRGVGEAEVRAAVDDDAVVAERLRDLGGLAVRQREERPTS